jgi:LPXTG-site transpeptidase (sortase) family protein
MITRTIHRLALAGLCLAAGLSAVPGSRSAIASEPGQSSGLSLESYAPDQSLWSEKMRVKYEKVKNDSTGLLAMLKIDSLNLEAPVYMGTDRLTLDRGVGVVDIGAYPGEVGNIAMSGHRDSFFRPLKDIKLGDEITLRTAEANQRFEVVDILIVDALDVSVLDPTETTVLTLITCYPFYYVGYAPDRYIVKATPVGVETAILEPDSAREPAVAEAGGNPGRTNAFEQF